MAFNAHLIGRRCSSSLQPETHYDLNIGDDRLRSTHGGLELPALQRFQSGVVHRAGCGAEKSDVANGPVSQDSHRDGGVAEVAPPVAERDVGGDGGRESAMPAVEQVEEGRRGRRGGRRGGRRRGRSGG